MAATPEEIENGRRLWVILQDQKKLAAITSSDLIFESLSPTVQSVFVETAKQFARHLAKGI